MQMCKFTATCMQEYVKTQVNWGEPERAPLRQYNVEISVCLSVIRDDTSYVIPYTLKTSYGAFQQKCFLNELSHEGCRLEKVSRISSLTQLS